MSGRRTFIVVIALCGLAFSAIAAPSATAAGKGTQAFKCSSEAEDKEFDTEHCVPGEAGAAFGHEEIPLQVATDASASNGRTDATTSGPTSMTFHWKFGGAKASITATGVKSLGVLQNNLLFGGEHLVEAVTAEVEFTGVTIPDPKCAVEGSPGGPGLIKSKALRATTKEHGMGVKFTPEVGELLAEFKIVKSGMAACAQAGTYPVVGRLTGIPDGATIRFSETETTNSNTLHVGSSAGPVAGLDGVVTIRAKEKGASDSLTEPVVATTLETP